MDSHNIRPSGSNTSVQAPMIAHARFCIGDVVKHRMFGFRGVVFDIDPVFANSEEWYQSIPQDMRPDRNQPFYHLLAENGESSYRSEEHTSELQSLMRISYAVFCLKKKNIEYRTYKSTIIE